MSLDSNLVDLATEIGNVVKQKQDKLTSGTTIRTINGTSILGAGNIVISGSGGNQNVFIQSDEPVVNPGEKALWIETLANGDFSFYIKTGE